MGSGEFEVNFTIDWISVTVPIGKELELLKGLYGEHVRDGIKAAPPKGYNQATEYEGGIRVAWNTKREEMGVHASMSGSSLRFLYAKGIHWHDLFRVIAACNGRTSRVDLAIDIKNGGIKLADISEANLKPYKGKGRTPRFLPVGTQEKGWSVYIGARQSDKYLRIYDKAKEQKDYVSDYVRVELETKGEVAHAVGWNFAKISERECVGMARGLILGVADFNLASWGRAFSGDIVGFSLPQGKERDTFTWLIKACAPALAKEIARRPSEDVLEAFWYELRRKLTELGVEVN